MNATDWYTLAKLAAYKLNNPLRVVDPEGMRYCLASGGPCFEDPIDRALQSHSSFLEQERLKCARAFVASNLDNHLRTFGWFEPGARWYLTTGADLTAATTPLIAVLGGAAIGGGAATSRVANAASVEADFAGLKSGSSKVIKTVDSMDDFIAILDRSTDGASFGATKDYRGPGQWTLGDGTWIGIRVAESGWTMDVRTSTSVKVHINEAG